MRESKQTTKQPHDERIGEGKERREMQTMQCNPYLEDIQTDVSILIYIGMKARSFEFDSGSIIGICIGEFDR